MQYVIHRATERGTKDLGWLQSNFSFSFSSYQNPINNGFGLLKTLNDDFVKPGGGFGLHPHQPVILTVARLVWEKGIDCVVEVAFDNESRRKPLIVEDRQAREMK